MPQMQLSYINSEVYAEQFNNSDIGACIVHSSFEQLKLFSSVKSYLVTDENPEQLFYQIFMYFVQENTFQVVEDRRGANIYLAKTAVIGESVAIGNDCVIMDNVVIMPNTILGDRVIIKPNTVIGGDGFQVKDVGGKRKVIPHVGGVYISDDVEIGSCITIDKGLFGEFTSIDKEVKIDNLVNIAHSTRVGRRTIIAAGVTLAGGVSIGSNVFIGMQASVNQLLTIPDCCYVGAHAAIINPLKAHQKVVGVPARRIGWICCCGNDINSPEGSVSLFCPNCENRYFLNKEGDIRKM
jgi:UDP-3-O-[3-hydroxymyristoyl] glucosamine N-acyltransferase